MYRSGGIPYKNLPSVFFEYLYCNEESIKPPPGSCKLVFLSNDMYASYKKWVAKKLPDFMSLHKIKIEQKRFKHQPKISIVMSVTDGKIDNILERIDSVLGQVYDNWELNILLSSSCVDIEGALIKYTKKYRNIKVSSARNKEYEADAINSLVDGIKCDRLAFLEQGDVLWPNALYEVVRALNEDHDRDIIYTDEDQIPDDRHDHVAPFFKPDWNPELLESINYITSILVISRSLYIKAGGMRSESGSAYWWDLSFRITRAAKAIHHVPKILYSRRLRLDRDDKYIKQIVASEKKVLKNHTKRANYIITLEKNNEIWNAIRTTKDDALVSIIIPTKNQYTILNKCIKSIYKKTLYKNFEIIIVDTGSTSRRVLRFYKRFTKRHNNLRVVNWHETPFSYSQSCNEGARYAKGSILVMLNNDTEVITPNWLGRLAAEARLPGVGAVGPMLMYADMLTVQHAGVGVGLGGVAANLLSGLSIAGPLTRSQYLMLYSRRNVSALTGACMAIRKDIFEKIGGFDEGFRVTYNDVDLCLRLIVAGYKNIYIPDVQLIHHESVSLGLPEKSTIRDKSEFYESMNSFVSKWKEYVEHDPALNSSLDKTNAHYKLKL